MPSDLVYGTPRNADSVALTRGMLVRVSATNGVVRAQANSAANLAGLAGVVGSGSVGVGGPAINVVGYGFHQPVLLEAGLTPVAGDTLYVSASVAGRATNVAPGIAVAIGTIVDVSPYSSSSMVYAVIAASAAIGGGSIAPGSIPLSALANLPAATVIGSQAGGVPEAVTMAQLQGLLEATGASIAWNRYTQVIDLTAAAPADYPLLPAAVQTGRFCFVVTPAWEIKSTNTVTVAPTFSVGTNAPNYDNLAASQTPAGFTTAVAEQRLSITLVVPLICVDLSSGVFVRVTNPATATALTARFFTAFGLLPT